MSYDMNADNINIIANMTYALRIILAWHNPQYFQTATNIHVIPTDWWLAVDEDDIISNS